MSPGTPPGGLGFRARTRTRLRLRATLRPHPTIVTTRTLRVGAANTVLHGPGAPDGTARGVRPQPLPTAVTSRGQRRENGVSSLSPLC